MGRLGFWDLLLIFGLLVLLFGATRLPALGASLGQAIRNFKKGFGGDETAPPEGQPKHDATNLPSGQQSASATQAPRKTVVD